MLQAGRSNPFVGQAFANRTLNGFNTLELFTFRIVFTVGVAGVFMIVLILQSLLVNEPLGYDGDHEKGALRLT